MTGNERKLLLSLAAAIAPVGLDVLAVPFLIDAGNRTRASSWARNSLRAPLRAKHVRRVSRGQYEITPAGRAVLFRGDGIDLALSQRKPAKRASSARVAKKKAA